MNRLDLKARKKVVQQARAQAPGRSRSAARTTVASDETPPTAIDSPGKRRLIEAAALEFAERGFDGASVLTIAERAGVKQPLVNYHFGGKEGLWRAVVDEGYDSVRAIAELEPEAAEDPLQRLKELLVTFAGVNARHRWIHAIVLKETSSAAGARLDWLVDNHMVPFNRHLTAQIEACVARGIFKPVPPQQAIVMFTGAVAGIFIASGLPSRLYGEDLADREVAQHYVDNAIDVLCAGLMREPGASAGRSRSKRQG
jgi:AcrR family transcriptional regulator